MDAQQLLKELEQRKQKNLLFFSQYFPSMYERFKDASMQTSRLNINPVNLEVNLVENEKTVYPEPVADFNEQEAQDFSDAFSEELCNRSIRHHCYSDFFHGRYAHGLTALFLKRLGYEEPNHCHNRYRFDHGFGQLVFLGCGLGSHIKALLKKRTVKHVMVTENNPDRFLASLYVTDWEELIMPYLSDNSTSFTITIEGLTNTTEKERLFRTSVKIWNHICQNVPFLPVQTVFYIHQGDTFYSKAVARIDKEIEPFINTWGYYDDEVNQFNHFMHNVRNNVGILQKQDLSSDKRITLICGNGPSLDKMIPVIKQHRGKFNLIAAGSAAHSLLMQGIYPDVCTTLESDKASYEYFFVTPEKMRKKINLIGAAQIYPDSFKLFNKSLMYLKSETSYAKIFSNGEDIARGTPSATNCALAIALDLNFSNIYLTGLDYGFASKEKTHSDSSFYRSEDSTQDLKDYTRNLARDSYLLEENQFGKIYTTEFYNTSRVHAERKIRSTSRKDIINLSQGATIDGTTWGSVSELNALLEDLELEGEQACFFDTLYENARYLDETEAQKGLAEIQATFNEFKQKSLAIINDLQPSIDSIEATAFEINQLIVNDNEMTHRKAILCIHGSVWFWLFNLYTIAKRIDNKVDLKTLVKEWKHYFGFFISNLSQHFLEFIEQDAKDSKRLEVSIAEKEPNIENWLEMCERTRKK